MNLDLKKQWFVLYTRPGCERKVAELLEKKHVEVYLPSKQNKQAMERQKKTCLTASFQLVCFRIYITR